MTDRPKEAQMVQPRLVPLFTPTAGTVGVHCQRCHDLHATVKTCSCCGKTFCHPCWAIHGCTNG